MRVLLLLMLLLPQLAAAGVYMCVDEITGKTSFTDKGCQTTASREEVKVPPANANSGSRTQAIESIKEKTWVSDRDTRKTGRDYTAERRKLADNSPLPGIGIDIGDI